MRVQSGCVAICYDPTLITESKSFHIQTISTLFNLMAPCHFRRILAFPYHPYLKSSSPQMPAQDMEIKSAFFAGSLIREGFGKLAADWIPLKIGG
jgi:hypothetical protein